MKKTMRKMIALLLSVLVFMSLFAAIPANASEQSGVFTVKAVSNLFPAAQTRYTDLAQYEDANGDVYITVEFKMCALGMYLVNLDVDAVRTVTEGINAWHNEHNSLLIITHNAKILEGLKVDKVHVLEGGKIVKTGGAEIIGEITEGGFNAVKEDN